MDIGGASMEDKPSDASQIPSNQLMEHINSSKKEHAGLETNIRK